MSQIALGKDGHNAFNFNQYSSQNCSVETI